LALGTATISVLLQRHRAYDAALLASAWALSGTTGPATGNCSFAL
jgi:hypothetical protein